MNSFRSLTFLFIFGEAYTCEKYCFHSKLEIVGLVFAVEWKKTILLSEDLVTTMKGRKTIPHVYTSWLTLEY